MDKPRTTTRPVSRRQDTGFGAWQATLGYISTVHNPDAALKIDVQPGADGLVWSASVSWGQAREVVATQPSLAEALGKLWQDVARYHTIFLDEEDTVRRPVDYGPMEWLDLKTHDILHRLTWTTRTAFRRDWLLLFIYRASEIPDRRVQARLLARGNSVQVGGRGPTLMSATRDLFHNAAGVFAQFGGDDD